MSCHKIIKIMNMINILSNTRSYMITACTRTMTLFKNNMVNFEYKPMDFCNNAEDLTHCKCYSNVSVHAFVCL